MGDDSGDTDRSAILRRRNRFVSIALSGLAAGALGACQACLGARVDDDAGIDAGRDAGSDAEPQVCLSAPLDAGPRDAAPEDAGAADADGGSDAAV